MVIRAMSGSSVGVGVFVAVTMAALTISLTLEQRGGATVPAGCSEVERAEPSAPAHARPSPSLQTAMTAAVVAPIVDGHVHAV